MPKIYQIFDLDKDAMEKLTDEELENIDFATRGKELLERLENDGYKVLILDTQYRDIPESIIVSAEIGVDIIKSDFSDIANDLGLLFKYGPIYTPTKKQE